MIRAEARATGHRPMCPDDCDREHLAWFTEAGDVEPIEGNAHAALERACRRARQRQGRYAHFEDFHGIFRCLGDRCGICLDGFPNEDNLFDIGERADDFK